MTEWKARRFWKEATVTEARGGYTVLLDTRPVKTPAKSALVVPTVALANRIAAEWDAQEDDIAPQAMPFTRSANAAIDKVARQQAEVADMIAAYGDSDLLCYRAEDPEPLCARQAAAWDPLLDWAETSLGARLIPVAGVMHRPQERAALDRLAARVHALDPFTLTAFHDLVALSGSLIIGFAALYEREPAPKLWALSRIDETWQEEQWGIDDVARNQANKKQCDFLHAKVFADLAQAG